MALPGYLEDTAKDYAKQATATYGTALQPSTFMGQQFVAPGEDQLQTDAITYGSTAESGILCKPYLTSSPRRCSEQQQEPI